MSKMFKIALPDGSVREVPAGSTPADVAAAIGPGLAKAALAARVDGELRDLNRPFEGDSSLALVTSRDEKDALELVRHDFAHVLAEAVQELFPGTQITFGPATEDGFYYDFAPAPGRGPFTDEDLPAIEEAMRKVIARDEALVREEWSRDQVRAFFEKQGESFKAEWVMELPEGEAITMYRSGGHGRLDGPVPRAAPRIDRQARPAGVQADPCVGRLLARRPEEPDAQPHLRHRLAQQEAARRASRPAGGGGQARPSPDRAGHGPVPPPVRSARQRVLAPQGVRPVAPARGLYAPPARRGRLCRGQDPAVDGRRAMGAVGPLGQVSREYVRRPRRDPERRRGRAGPVGQERSDGAEADELPGACADLQAGHHQLSRAADSPGRIRLLPPQRAARRAPRHHARAPVHPGRRAYLLPRGSVDRGGAEFCDLLD